MATQARKTETIELQSGEKVEIRPLNIKQLRKFMEVVERFQTADDKSQIDVMIDAAAVALEPFKPEIAEDRDKLEEELDIPTIWTLLEVAGGITQGNPTTTTAGMAGRR
jgi:hypothetical protein